MTGPNVLNVVITTPENRGEGAVRAGLQLGKHLAKQTSVDTAMMESKHNDELAREIGLEDELHSIPSNTLLRDLSKSLVDFEENFANILIWTRLSPLTPIKSYDVVHIHNPVPLAGMVRVAISCRLANVPYCVTTHGISKIPDLPDAMNLSRLQEAVFNVAFMRPYIWVLRNATHLFALSESDRNQLRSLLPTPSVSVVPNGVEMNPPEPDAAEIVEQITGFDSSEPLLLFVGKIRESKGIADLLAAYERLNTDPALVIAGQSQNADLADRIQQFKERNVVYPGYLSREELDALFQRADIFVFPTRSDVFPLVNLEAMASRTAVISTDVGGIPEQLNDGAGIVVPPNDPKELAVQVNDMLTNEEMREQTAMRGYERAAGRFSWSGVAERTIEDYERHVL